MVEPALSDVQAILARRQASGGDLWATPDGRLMKGSPYTTLDCACMLADLGLPPDDPTLRAVADLIFTAQRPDGRFRVSPDGAIYPCHTIAAVKTLCCLGYAADARLATSLNWLLANRYGDGGWRCNKFSFGRGPETDRSNPGPTLSALDAFRYCLAMPGSGALDEAVTFLLSHWTLRAPLGPCHYGIGSRFMQVTYPFSSYNLFYYVYVLSYYPLARADARFGEALAALQGSMEGGSIVVRRQNPGLKALASYRQGAPCPTGTARYRELMQNLSAVPE